MKRNSRPFRRGLFNSRNESRRIEFESRFLLDAEFTDTMLKKAQREDCTQKEKQQQLFCVEHAAEGRFRRVVLRDARENLVIGDEKSSASRHREPEWN